MQAHRDGLARGDLLVTLGLLLLAGGVALPAVQGARGVADKTKCQNNLQAIGRGFLEFEKLHGGFPPRRTGFADGSPRGGWGPFVLPYIGQADLGKKYSFKLDFYDPGNKAAAETNVATFACPASPENRKVRVQSQATGKSENPDKDTLLTVDGGIVDYISANTVLMPAGGYGLNRRIAGEMASNERQALADDSYLPTSKITDGLSNTLLLIEQAGRPQNWRVGKRTDSGDLFGMTANARGAWAGWGSIGFGPAKGTDGTTPAKGDATDCSVNCNNQHGIYGFHTGGANVLFCDGSVRFVGVKLDPLTFAYLTLRDDGHVISLDDY